jgi:autotransporter-associated beta strand protein
MDMRVNLVNDVSEFNVADGAQPVDLALTSGIGDVSWWGGTASMRKTGPGTMLLQGNSSIAGTEVAEGTLLVDGSLAGDVDVQPGGTISAGSLLGHMIVTDASSYTQSGTMLVELGGMEQGTEYDWIEVDSGAADVSGLVDILLVDSFQPASGATFDVLTASAGVSDGGITLDWDPARLRPAQYWKYSIEDLAAGGQALRLELAVPEPTTFALALLGLLGLGVIARQRRRK